MEVTFFPRKDIDVKICDYRFGKRFAIQQNTDSGLNPYAPFQLFQAFKYGIKYTMFTNKYSPGGVNSLNDEEYQNHFNTGLVDIQHYFSTDRWINPNTGVDEVISDYYATSWTTLGANAFGVTLGDSKIARTPNHGQQLYDLTSGLFGFDVVNGVMGSSQLSEFIGIKAAQSNWADELELYRSSTFSYRNGQNLSPAIYKLLYVAGRNSVRDITFFYGGNSKEDGQSLGNDLPISRTRQVNQPETTRWVDSYISTTPGAMEAANNQVRTKITEAYNNRGVYYDFSHHHSAGSTEMLEDLFKTIGEHLDNENIRSECWIAGYGEVNEYYWFRQLTKRAVGTIVGDAVYITIEWNDLKTTENGISDGILKEMLQTPLSVEIDLTGTPLAGKLIKNSGGEILSLGSNKYIVGVPFGNAIDGCRGVELMEGSGEYLPSTDLIYSLDIVSNSLTITTNHRTNAVLFSHDISTGSIYAIIPIEFSNDKTEHEFNISDTSKKYYVGIKDWKESKIIEITALD